MILQILAVGFNTMAILGWIILIVIIFDAIALDGQLVTNILTGDGLNR